MSRTSGGKALRQADRKPAVRKNRTRGTISSMAVQRRRIDDPKGKEEERRILEKEMRMQIKECSRDDVALLAVLNQELIEDEKAETDLNLNQLRERMEGFLHSGYRAFLFGVAGKTVGYALCDMSRAPLYLRQFYICRDERRKGYGRQAFQALLCWLGIHEVDIDVYAWNTTGRAFWKALGFETRCHAMRYKEG